MLIKVVTAVDIDSLFNSSQKKILGREVKGLFYVWPVTARDDPFDMWIC